MQEGGEREVQKGGGGKRGEERGGYGAGEKGEGVTTDKNDS